MQRARRHFWLAILAATLLAPAAAQPSPAPAQPSPAPAAAAQAPPPTRPDHARQPAHRLSRPLALLYTVKPGDTLDRVCATLRERAGYYSLDDMLAAVRKANRLQTNLLRPGFALLVPVAARAPTSLVADAVAAGADVRGIYLTGPACGVSSVLQRVDRFIAVGGNTVVFDAKDIDGAVTYRSAEPLAGWGPGRGGPVIPSLPDMVERFHERGLHVVARLAVFLDGALGAKRPELAVLGPDGTRCAEQGAAWLDPGRAETRAYNLALAAELARAGVDEVQLDYVRYPSGLRLGHAAGDVDGDRDATLAHRRDTITGFVSAVRDTLRAAGVALSVALSGSLGWDEGGDAAPGGQDVAQLAAVADVLCPTIYPAQFAPGFDGRPRPADEPGRFASEGVRRFRALAGSAGRIRPWLQAFPWHVANFDGDYVAAQVRAARGAGAEGWCLWNPASQYESALPVLRMLSMPLATAAAMGVPAR